MVVKLYGGLDMISINSKILQILNLIAIIATIGFNILVNVIPLNGVYTGDVANSYPNFFTPPGWVFSIWGVIYILLITFAVYQVRPNQVDEPYLQKIGLLYVFNAIANISWLIVFHYSYGNPGLFLWSVIPIALLLVILLLTYVQLEIGLKGVPLKKKLAVHLPVSVYAGWISLATIANIASALNVLIPGIPADVQHLWTAAVIIIALLITILMLYLRHDVAFALVVVWAGFGIAMKQMTIPIIFGTAITAVVLIVLLILLLPFIRKKGFVDYYLVRD
ncbi:MAG: conserved membrane protein of unknown function [Candidatus Thorarchaeota archaeon]|nr:MAG: conserved membrane protein of unknown function [Candidatus Thorarchaeota archaeon]